MPRPRPLALSPQSFRGLPAGEPLLSPTGTSPRSSSGLGEESLAGSTWGASSLATAQRGCPFAFAPAGSAELADTLTSRLRPLVTTANGPAGAGRTGSAVLRGGGEAAAPAASVQPHQEGSNLVFLSARPESYKGMTESESYRKYFQPFVQRGDLDTSPTMLLGAMTSCAGSVYWQLGRRVALLC
jgi:hypothetical protein